ncbi:DNA adenine methylase [Xanthomonas albilineans]|uniref:Putative n6 adenine-specific dna methyltransferase protein n=1 Tax=Xanthomonas albilineans (strain GPE PC73 / CFBP 7063) TaxID=380358 RepID=D2U8R8_XANAP|nr:DNA adenine methylase [Xanthomonas albilineans]CBA14724.1 putative n6 adenine-specific dna methyltransferase protein [Xanthomonas albilineans GPE PC73]
MITSPAFRYHGGKFRLSPWVQQHLPPHRTYVEPFGGAAGVLLTKPRSYAEVYNDLDGDVVNLFRVLQSPSDRDRLIEACLLTPYARSEFEIAWHATSDPVERARRLLIRAQMGFGSAGATKGTTGFRIDSQRAYGTAQQLWARFPPSLIDVAKRFTGVLIENRPAIEVMQQHDTPQTLHYVDPPYVHSTRVRAAGKAGYYKHEMSEADHQQLLDCLLSLDGMVMVSGYRTNLYDTTLAGWRRVETRARISGGRGTKIRTECMWISPSCAVSVRQGNLALGAA